MSQIHYLDYLLVFFQFLIFNWFFRKQKHKKGIYWITWNAPWVNLGGINQEQHCTLCEYKSTKDCYLNIKFACSARLWVNECCGSVCYTHWSKCWWCFQHLSSHCDMNTWTSSLELLWASLHKHFTISLEKTIIIFYTQTLKGLQKKLSK